MWILTLLKKLTSSLRPGLARPGLGASKLTKKAQKTLSIVMSLLVVITGSGMLYLFNPFVNKAQAVWYDDSWAYRQAITVTVTSNSSDITNLQTLITVNTSSLISSKLQSACQDLRFTNQNGKRLPYYIDSGCNTTTTKIWVMLDLVPKNTTTYTMFMYYGNPSAAAGSQAQPYFDNVVGLVGYWTMNDTSGSTVTDSSITGDNATANGTTTIVTGQYGNARNLDGSSGYISISGNSNLNAGHPTIEAWVKPTSMSGYGSIYNNRPAADNNGITFEPNNSSGGLQCQMPGLGVTLSSNGKLSNNVWSHIACTYDGSKLSIYINGSLDNSTNTSGTLSYGSSIIQLGKNDVDSEFYNGSIDDAKIYNTARSASQILNDYSNILPNRMTQTIATTAVGTIVPSTSFASEEKAPSPVAYWKFDEGYGTTTSDSTSNANTATLGGTTIPTWQTEDQCISGKCLYFDGSTSKVTGSKAALNVQTVAFWVRPNTIASQGLINLNDGSSRKINTNASGVISASGFTSPAYYINGIAATTPTLTANQWNYVVITTGTGVNSGTAVTIGTDGTNFTKGFFDEVKLYPSARSAAQVLADYNSKSDLVGNSDALSNANNNPSALNNGLVGYWKMDESSWNGTSGEVKDSSGNGNNGTSGCTGSGCTDATTATGKFGNGGSFTSSSTTGNFVDTGNSINLGSGSFSVASWFKTTASGAIVSKEPGSWGTGYNMQAIPYLTGYVGAGTQAASVYIQASSSLNDNTWHHGIFVVNQSTKRAQLYVDETQVAITKFGSTCGTIVGNDLDFTACTNVSATSTAHLYLGSNYGLANGSIIGTLDETRIYNRALSAQDIQNLYNFAPGPVAYYKFDEGTGSTVNDYSSNANAGTWNGTLGSQWKDGKFGGAGNFNGTNNYVSRSAMTSGGAGTTEAWIKPSGTYPSGSARVGVAGVLNSLGADITAEYTIMLYDSVDFCASGDWFTEVANGTSTQVVCSGQPYNSTNFPANTWTHLSVTYDGSTISLYKNGVLAKSVTQTVSGANTNSNTFSIGRWGALNGYYMNGGIDEVKLYNYARTQQQIIQDMNGGNPPPSGNIATGQTANSPGIAGQPVGYWKFDEGYGTTANNSGSGGSALNGTLTNMSSPATSTSGWTQSGKFGKALVYNGSNNYVSVTDSSSLSFTSAITVSAWVKTTVTQSGIGMVAKGPNTTDYDFLLYLSGNSGSIDFYIKNSSGTADNEGVIAFTANDGNWHQYIGIYDGSNLKVYIDGALRGSKATALTNLRHSSNSLTIGTGYNGNYFNGSIDEVKVYSFALTPSQVLLDYNRGSAKVLGAISDNSSYQPNAANQEYCVPGDSTSCAAPVGRWDFEEGTGSTVNDSSGNANTGTLTNSPTWTTGKTGKGLKFTDNSYVDLGAAKFDTISTATIEMWFYYTGTFDTNRLLFYHLKDGNNRMPIFVSYSGGYGNKLVFENIVAASNRGVTSDSTITANTWYHAAFTCGIGGMKMFINGVQQASTNATTDCLSTIAITTQNTIGNNGSSFIGTIDGYRVFNYARTPAQIAWDYNRGAPVGWWKFDECQGTVANDSSGNGNTGTITIGASGSQTQAGTCQDGLSTSAWSNGKTGKINSSLNFDGTDDYVSFSGWPAFSGAAFSVSTWFKSTVNFRVGGQQYCGNMPFTLQLNGTSITFNVNNAAGTCGSSSATNSISFNTGLWHHAVGTFDGTNARLYIDGVLSGTGGAFSGSYSTARTDPFNFGRYDCSAGCTYGSGQIDDARVYNYALTASQVKTLYDNGAINYAPSTGAPAP